MDDLVLDGKTYVGSKKAAQECGYAQDYVGQLARKGFIDARRVSGQWYVQLESLKAYKDKAESFKPEPPKYSPDASVESTINVEGKEFVSAARAAKAAQYNQDYIAQLARAGKVPSRQVGNRWYVELEALLLHKKEKDAMLRAVQAEAVGLKRPEPRIAEVYTNTPKPKAETPIMTYSQENKPLFPEIEESVALKAIPYAPEEEPVPVGPFSKIPIRVLKPLEIEVRDEPVALATKVESIVIKESRVASAGKTRNRAISWQLAVAAVLLVVVGVGAYKKDAIYAMITNASNAGQTSSAAGASASARAILDSLLTKEITYIRE